MNCQPYCVKKSSFAVENYPCLRWAHGYIYIKTRRLILTQTYQTSVINTEDFSALCATISYTSIYLIDSSRLLKCTLFSGQRSYPALCSCTLHVPWQCPRKKQLLWHCSWKWNFVKLSKVFFLPVKWTRNLSAVALKDGCDSGRVMRNIYRGMRD